MIAVAGSFSLTRDSPTKMAEHPASCTTLTSSYVKIPLSPTTCENATNYKWFEFQYEFCISWQLSRRRDWKKSANITHQTFLELRYVGRVITVHTALSCYTRLCMVSTNELHSEATTLHTNQVHTIKENTSGGNKQAVPRQYQAEKKLVLKKPDGILRSSEFKPPTRELTRQMYLPWYPAHELYPPRDQPSTPSCNPRSPRMFLRKHHTTKHHIVRWAYGPIA